MIAFEGQNWKKKFLLLSETKLIMPQTGGFAWNNELKQDGEKLLLYLYIRRLARQALKKYLLSLPINMYENWEKWKSLLQIRMGWSSWEKLLKQPMAKFKCLVPRKWTIPNAWSLESDRSRPTMFWF